MSLKRSSTFVAAPRIAAGDDRTHYDGLAMTLHWLTTLLVLTQFGLAQLWDLVPRAAAHLMIVAHMSFGIILMLVLVVRISWRLIPGHRVSAATVGWMGAVSQAVHRALYGLLATEMMLGFLLRWSDGKALSFFGLLIAPPFPPLSESAQDWVGDIHNWLAWIILAVAAGHAFAALFHHFVLHDGVLWRMLPGRRARQQTDLQSSD